MNNNYNKDCGLLKLGTLDDLAKTQGVDPSFDVSALFGTWPGEPDDGFEVMIHNHRQHENSLLDNKDD
ncbi:MAG: hypothetical protein JXB48_04530 [Candidatus Latescibacteria bacterium]|nr:hypothetical protein [Candidatus Latescibacterota bacterium]